MAIFRAMLLGLLRDRGALITSFVLPPVFFCIFAEIAGVAGGGEMNLKVALADEARSDGTVRLVRRLGESEALQIMDPAPDSPANVRERVRSGAADVGVILRSHGETLEGESAGTRKPLLIVLDPARSVAGAVLAGELRRAYAVSLSDAGPATTVGSTPAGSGPKRWSFDEMLATEAVAGQHANLNPAAYYAGAVAFMFLLFASMHGAISLLEERDSGVLDRILAGPGGIAVLVNGKYLYLVLQGTVQVSLIFLVAWLAYGVDLPANFIPWAVVTLIAVLAAAGFAMFVATACRTRRQAQTLSNVLILILSALGGSMVPRFLMPEALQAVGWATPNTWALEAYAAVLWRGQPLLDSWLPLGLLLSTAVLGLGLANLLARRMVAS